MYSSERCRILTHSPFGSISSRNKGGTVKRACYVRSVLHGFPTALGLSVAKGVFALASRGVSAGLLSLTGGVLSTLIMYILKRVFKKKISLTLISVFGAIVHNAGQLLAASLLWRTLAVWSISPILIISGIVFGTVNALLVKLTLPYLSRLGEKK